MQMDLICIIITKIVMETSINRVVLILRSSTNGHQYNGGGSFSYKDVELIAFHLKKQFKGPGELEIICLWDKVTQPINLVNVKVLPMKYHWPKWWAKMNIFAPEMEQYRPFLYIDLDTLILNDLSEILPPTPENINKFITLGEFTDNLALAKLPTSKVIYSGIMWIPANNIKIRTIWEKWIKSPEYWMNMPPIKGVSMPRVYGDQDLIRAFITTSDTYWQRITNKIGDFKSHAAGIRTKDEVEGWTEYLRKNPDHYSVLCLHGKPKMYKAAEYRSWIRNYIEECFPRKKAKVTIIIPYKYNPNRPWLQDAINSVPKDCQLLVSEGPGMWATNFKKVLHLAEGKYIKYLHDDDMLTPNCIADSVKAIEEQGVDFIHGNAIELEVKTGRKFNCIAPIKGGSKEQLLKTNFIHSATTMYKREIFEKIGSFDETLPDSEEYEFNLRCLANGFKLGYCDSFLAVYRRHPAQQTSILGGKQLMDTSRKIAEKYKV